MQDQEKAGATPDERIAHAAKAWRPKDKAASAETSSRKQKRAAYHALQQLRQVIDTVGSKS